MVLTYITLASAVKLGVYLKTILQAISESLFAVEISMFINLYTNW